MLTALTHWKKQRGAHWHVSACGCELIAACAILTCSKCNMQQEMQQVQHAIKNAASVECVGAQAFFGVWLTMTAAMSGSTAVA